MKHSIEKAIFFDRDGVLLREPPRGAVSGYKAEAINTWAKFEILPTVAKAFTRLNHKPYRLLVVSNQEGIGEGFLSREFYEATNQQLLKFIADQGGTSINHIYTCPHPVAGICECRKPKRGLIDQALKDFPNINLSTSWVVGDRPSDLQLGNLIDARTIFLRMNHPLPEDITPDVSLSHVDEAVEYILYNDKT